MKLALLGHSITHSRSPSLYKKFFGSAVQYDLLDISSKEHLPSLDDLAALYRGVNITSPYKEFYFDKVLIMDQAVLKIGAINTISFTSEGVFGTNTDLIAVREILQNFKSKYSQLSVLLLGSGVMARVTEVVCQELGLEFHQFSRTTGPDLATKNLAEFQQPGQQNLIINACSRQFVFQGGLSGEEIFWDYNYHFIPHQNTLPFRVKEYHDGQEMLHLQAQAAVEFWDFNKD
jgi:shikimate dehydrogenase